MGTPIFFGIPSGNQTWQWNITYQWRFLARKITVFDYQRVTPLNHHSTTTKPSQWVCSFYPFGYFLGTHPSCRPEVAASAVTPWSWNPQICHQSEALCGAETTHLWWVNLPCFWSNSNFWWLKCQFWSIWLMKSFLHVPSSPLPTVHPTSMALPRRPRRMSLQPSQVQLSWFTWYMDSRLLH